MHRIALIHKDRRIVWCHGPVFSSDEPLEGILRQELSDRYQGFDGYVILMFPVWEHSPRFHRRLQTCINYVKQGGHILLHVLDGCSVMSPSMQQQAEKKGYDVGRCIPESFGYSSIWEEIIRGDVNELVEYRKFLNKHLLFPNRMRAKQYLAVHGEMERQGKGVEIHAIMKIHEVWRHKIDMRQG